MSRHLALKTEDSAAAISRTQAACPRCNAALELVRSDTPRIDDCGFESYRFECTDCGTALIGIIDPADDTLLVSERTY